MFLFLLQGFGIWFVCVFNSVIDKRIEQSPRNTPELRHLVQRLIEECKVFVLFSLQIISRKYDCNMLLILLCKILRYFFRFWQWSFVLQNIFISSINLIILYTIRVERTFSVVCWLGGGGVNALLPIFIFLLVLLRSHCYIYDKCNILPEYL